MKLIILSVVVCLFFLTEGAIEFKYHTNTELETVLTTLEEKGRKILNTRLYTIGNSSSLKNPERLWVLELTAAKKSQLGVPNVKLVGNMHGNEAGGREILLHFIEYLIDEYTNNNQTVMWLLQHTKIHVIPSLNPDGFADSSTNVCSGIRGRYVPNGKIDLNRNFPDYFKPDPDLEPAKETKAIMKLMHNTKFILSAALHEGALVANYPFDNNAENYDREFLTPDDDVFKFLAKTYSDNHPEMHSEIFCESAKRTFDKGVVNGAEWYRFEGGMGDYNYNFHGCMELTLELSCCKYPSPDTLSKLWNDNKQSLIVYCMQANKGVTGRILDSVTRKPVEAKLTIEGRDAVKVGKEFKEIYFKSWNKTGEFWRLLLPGNYTLKIEASGYYLHSRKFEVKEHRPFPKLTFLNISLLPTSISTTTHVTPPEKSTSVINLTSRFSDVEVVDAQELKSVAVSKQYMSFVMLVNMILLVQLT